MMLVAFRRLVLQCVQPDISLAMLYVNVVVSHVYDSTRVTLTSRSQLDLVAQTVEHRSRNAKVAGSNPSRGQVEFSACPVWYTLV